MTVLVVGMGNVLQVKVLETSLDLVLVWVIVMTRHVSVIQDGLDMTVLKGVQDLFVASFVANSVTKMKHVIISRDIVFQLKRAV